MIRSLTFGAAAALALALPQMASATCIGDASAQREQCIANGPRAASHISNCDSFYRETIAQCPVDRRGD